MSGQHVDYQPTEQCWNNALTFLKYLNSFHYMLYLYLKVCCILHFVTIKFTVLHIGIPRPCGNTYRKQAVEIVKV